MTSYTKIDKNGFKWEFKCYDLGFQKYEDMSNAQKYVYDMEKKYPGIASIPMPTTEQFKKILEDVKYDETKNKRNKK